MPIITITRMVLEISAVAIVYSARNDDDKKKLYAALAIMFISSFLEVFE